jgi:dTDP-4-dehydrorhamnose reductase
MKILVTGVKGQLGCDVVREGQKRGFTMIGSDLDDCDLQDETAVKSLVDSVRPDVVIHCAAYTAVDRAESEKERCYDVNVNGTKYIAKAAQSVGAKLIYLSTDYVFDGEGQMPHRVEEEKRPVNYYGYTKSLGEDMAAQENDHCFIVRVSWVFGVNGNNFVKTMVRLGREKEEISVVSDQIGAPTYTADLAVLLLDMAVTEKYGIYHAANSGVCSWYDFAKEIMDVAGFATRVNPIVTKDYPTAAARPKNSRLDQTRLTENGFSPLPSWENALKRYIRQLNGEM